MKKCKGPCGRDLENSCFGKVNGYARHVCNYCRWKQRSPASFQKQADMNAERQRQKRRNQPAVAILRDSKKSDRKKGLDNDLDLAFIESLIENPCFYCGETLLRMTLDRRDNSLGHLKSNVEAACLRCNYVRGAMPYEAWLYLVPGIRQAREAGAFGEWVGGMHKFVGVLKMAKGSVCKTDM